MSKNKPDEAIELAKIAAPRAGVSVVQARHWLRTGTEPKHPLVRKAWTRAVTAARARLAKSSLATVHKA